MKTLSTNQFVLEQVQGNLFNVFKRHYAPEITTSYGQVELHEDIIKGLENNPISGYWADAVKQCIEKHGKLYEKYKI